MTMISLLRFVDRVLFWTLIHIFSWLKLFPVCTRKKEIQVKKVLVIRLWALGSSLLTFPMIEALRVQYGQWVEYHLLATSRNKHVFKNQEYFHQVVDLFTLRGVWDMFCRFKSYDLVIDTEEYFRLSSLVTLWVSRVAVGYANIRSRQFAYIYPVVYNDRQHAMETYMDLLRPLFVPVVPPALVPIKYTPSDAIWVDSLLTPYGTRLKIALHAGWAETSPDRFWPIENWAALVPLILRKYPNAVIFLTGTHIDEMINRKIIESTDSEYRKNVVDLSWKMSIFSLAYFYTQIAVAIANDTGPMHLSAAMGTRTIWLFGPNLPARFGPYPMPPNVAVYKWSWASYINVHEGTFRVDSTKTIAKITPSDIISYL